MDFKYLISLFTDNTEVIVAVIIAIAVVIFTVRRGKEGIYKTALYLVSVAEEEWGSKMGKVKFAEVYSAIKKQYPILTLFLPESKITEIIELALVELKQILAQKQALESEEEQSSSK